MFLLFPFRIVCRTDSKIEEQIQKIRYVWWQLTGLDSSSQRRTSRCREFLELIEHEIGKWEYSLPLYLIDEFAACNERQDSPVIVQPESHQELFPGEEGDELRGIKPVFQELQCFPGFRRISSPDRFQQDRPGFPQEGNIQLRMGSNLLFDCPSRSSISIEF
jgi:hypothetical protein